MKPELVVKNFYKSDVLLDVETVASFLHEDVVLEWHSTKGFFKMNYDSILALSRELKISYVRSKIKINHLIAKGDTVAVRYSHYAKTIENPREDMLLAHFMVIWEVKEGKLYRGYQMSQV